MAIVYPDVEEVEGAVADLLREVEYGSLAVVGPTGAPAVSMMHFAADGLAVYFHTFTYTRKFSALQHDPRVSYTMAFVPPEGFAARGDARSVQVEGIATMVADQAEIDRAIEVSREQFEWLKDVGVYDTFAKGTAHHQRFFRIDPVEGMWNDNRVRQPWRQVVIFTEDHRHIASMRPYKNRNS